MHNNKLKCGECAAQSVQRGINLVCGLSLLSSHTSHSYCNLCLLERQHDFARTLFMYFLRVIVNSCYIFV